MLHPHTRLEWIDDEIGYGVFAARPIPRGTILWVHDPLDRRLSPDEVENIGPTMWPELEKYTYIDRHGDRILCWDFGRYMNHSCEPVSLSAGADFELAVRDLAEGDEITCDYASLNLERDFECRCRRLECRGWVSNQQFDGLVPRWDTQLRVAMGLAQSVAQPLRRYLRDPAGFISWSGDTTAMPSSAVHRWHGQDVVARAMEAAPPPVAE